MKKTFKKVLSVMLVVIIFATSLPFNALAKDDTTQNNQNISTDMGDMSFTATNSFGEMLTDSLSEYTGEQNGEYYISDIEYEGYCALVTFATQQGCTIMVAAYEEDTGRMITSASVDVFAEDTEAFVEFEDELPDYFVLKAFMLDDNAAPLCKAYTCNEMTQAYEDFAATTIDDYDEDKVINLDEDETTNFLVMSDETTTITNDGKTNVLVSYDEETGVYTFDNIDEQITSLRKDDIFYFDNGNVEELTFIKVGTVDIDGTTAYITEAEASLEEVFDVVKLDNEMTSGEFSLNEDEELEDGVTYLGCEEVEEPDDEVSTFGFDNEHTVTYKHNYKVKKDIKPKNLTKISNDVALTGSIKLNGNFGFSLSGKLKYYISNDFTEIEFTLTPSFVLNVTVEGVGRIEINMLPILCSPCPGVSVGLTPKFIVEASVKATLDATLKFTVGIGYNSDEGFVNKSKKPTFKPELKVEGEIFVGIDLCPKAFIASEKLAKLELTSEIGAKLTSEMSTDQGAGHLCDSCLDGKIFLVGDLTGKLVFGDKTKFEKELSVNFLDIKIKITDFYYSFTKNDFGWLDHCPNSLTVRGKCGKNLEWAYNYQTETLTITGKGKMFDYENDNVPWFDYRFDGIKKIVIGNSVTTIGEYAFYFCGELTAVEIGKGLTEIGDNAFGDCDNLTDVYYSGTQDEWDEIEIGINNDDLINAINDGDDSVTENGTCGKNVTWKFNESTGTLTISGTDAMENYSYSYSNYSYNRPWESYEDSIKTVVIIDGVTTIGDWAFYSCDSLTSITIPDSVTTIGDGAFYWCDSLTSVTIPDSVTTIGDCAFSYCDSLTSITVDSDNQYFSNDEYGVLFNKNKTTLIQYPSGNTRTNYTIPDSVTTIGNYAFHSCESLTSVVIPDSVTTIGDSAFKDCNRLTSVTIGDSVTAIGKGAFRYCYSLTSVTIPDSVTTIGDSAFEDCDSLTSVTIPDSVTTIGDYAFYDCNRLTSVTIPDSVTTIGYSAFDECISLTDVYYSGTKEQWNKITIGSYNYELTGATIHYNSTGTTYSLKSKQPKMMSFAMAKSNALTVYNATASNAILGNEYVIVVLNDTADINDFTNNELLYIDQKTAETDGNITFNYVPKTNDDCIVYIVGVFSDTNSVKQEHVMPANPNEPENPDYNFNFHIQQPSRTTIRNKDTIILHAIIDGTVPEGSYIEWDMSEGNFSLGWELDTEDTEVYATAEDKGYDTITAILYDADGNELARDSVELYSKSGFFDKIGGFFRMLFGATKTYYN